MNDLFLYVLLVTQVTRVTELVYKKVGQQTRDNNKNINMLTFND